MDFFTLSFMLWNFTVSGIFVLFHGKSEFIKRAYMVAISCELAYVFTMLPHLTVWILLGLIAIWDMIAVLCPFGPLRLILKVMKRDDKDIPAFIFSTMAWFSESKSSSRFRENKLPGSGVADAESLPDENILDDIYLDADGNFTEYYQASYNNVPKSNCASYDSPKDYYAPRGTPRKPPFACAEGSPTRVFDGGPYPYIGSSLHEDYPYDVDLELYNSAVGNADNHYYRHKGLYSPTEFRGKSNSSKALLYPSLVQKTALHDIHPRVGSRTNFPGVDRNLAPRSTRPAIHSTRKINTSASNLTASSTIKSDFVPGTDIPAKYAKLRPSRPLAPTGPLPSQSGSNNKNRVKIGLGDFAFYGIIVGLAASTDWVATVVCSLSVLVGLIATIFLLEIHGKALPALPISIALGAMSYFSSHLMIEFMNSFMAFR